MEDKSIMKARSVYYHLFSKFFVYQENIEVYLEIIKILKILDENPLDATCKESTTTLLKKLDPLSNTILVEEFNEIFYNPGTQIVRTTASFYEEGVEAGKKRVEAQQFLAKTKIRRNEASFTEHEDSFPFLVTILGELNELIIEGEESYNNTQHCLFEEILNIFVDDFSKNVYEHEKSDLFKDVIVLLKTFIEFERLYLNVTKPKAREIVTEDKSCDFVSDEEAARRAKNKAMKSEDDKPSCSLDNVYDVEDNIEID